jgi:hypothetical protein
VHHGNLAMPLMEASHGLLLTFSATISERDRSLLWAHRPVQRCFEQRANDQNGVGSGRSATRAIPVVAAALANSQKPPFAHWRNGCTNRR